MIRTKKATILTALILSTAACSVSAQDYKTAMEAALKQHGGGSYPSELSSAQAFIEIGEKHADQWLPFYWASYIYTQLANFHGRLPGTPENVTQSKLVEESQRYLDRAIERVQTPTSQISSDLNILQHFIHTLKVRFSEDEAGKEASQKAADAALAKAIASNPNNPLIYTLVAIDIAGRGREDLRGLLASLVMLETAQEKFEASGQPRALTTAWNQEWVSVWLDRISAQLIKVAEAQGQ